MSHIGGYSIEDLAGMSSEELNALLAQEWADLSEEELETAKTELDEEISAYKGELEDAADELEDAIDGIDDDAKRADAEELLEEVEEELAQVESLEETVGDEYVDIQEHSVDATDGSDVSISELDLDSGTYTYSMSGGSTNPFGDKSDEEYLQDEGITNSDGEVIKDYNLDGVMNQADIDAALKDRTALLDKQNVFIQTDSSQHWTLVSSNNGTYTFKVEDTSTEPPTYAYVTFENAADIVFYFSNGITETDFETMKTTWPTDLLKNCYWGNSTTSFYDELFENESGEESNLDGALTSELQTAAEEALSALYGYIDDPSQSVSEIWNDLFAAWDSAGYTDAQQALLIQRLTLAVFINDSANFGTLFGPAIVSLETMLDYKSDAHENYNANDKLIVMLLETKTGAVGNYGGATAFWTTVFSADGVTEGSWKDYDENVTAINNYKAVLTAAGVSLTGNEATALANEEAIQEEKAETATEGGTITMSENQKQDLLNDCAEIAVWVEGGLDDGVTEANLTSALRTLVEEIYNWSAGGISITDLQNKILNYINTLAQPEWRDDLAASIVILLGETNPDFLEKLLVDDWAEDMNQIIYNGYDDPGWDGEAAIYANYWLFQFDRMNDQSSSRFS